MTSVVVHIFGTMVIFNLGVVAGAWWGAATGSTRHHKVHGNLAHDDGQDSGV